jgi:hypothetical protein
MKEDWMTVFLIRPVFVQNYDLIRMALKEGEVSVCMKKILLTALNGKT